MAGTPRGKGRGRAVATKMGARVFTDEQTRRYETQLRYAAERQMNGDPPMEGPLRVIMQARFAVAPSWTKRKRAAALSGEIRPCTTPDADNLLKALDSFNGVVWQDDRQVVEATVYKTYAESPGLTIIVADFEAAR